jgi:hypothetical protein
VHARLLWLFVDGFLLQAHVSHLPFARSGSSIRQAGGEDSAAWQLEVQSRTTGYSRGATRGIHASELYYVKISGELGLLK